MDLSDLNVDPIKGTEILGFLGVHPNDITDPAKFSRLREVVQFFQNAPDARHIISKLTLGKNVDRVDHLWGYVTLRKEHDAKRKEINSLESELSIYET